MIIRPLAITDIDRVNEIFAKHHAGAFAIPPLERLLSHTVVTNDNDKVIAFGAIYPLIEAVMILDLDCSMRDKAEVLKQLIWEAIRGVSGKADGIHAFIQDPEYAKLLKKHFGFKTCKGEALYLEV
jgi:hypothetical protein